MKYIRTEDRICKCSTIPYCVPNYDGTKLLTKEGLGNEYPIEEHMIIEQADTIKELCDEFVVQWATGETPYLVRYIPDRDDYKVNDFEFGKSHIKEDLEKIKVKATLYGAIWTDKGLIYVAKMNEKGELELL